MSDAFKPLLSRLADGATLSDDAAGEFFAACLRGEPSPAQVGAALTAMRMRGETLGEIVACARAMRRAAVQIEPPYPTIDVCGTGGDGLHTLNISTAVAFVVAFFSAQLSIVLCLVFAVFFGVILPQRKP